MNKVNRDEREKSLVAHRGTLEFMMGKLIELEHAKTLLEFIDLMLQQSVTHGQLLEIERHESKMKEFENAIK